MRRLEYIRDIKLNELSLERLYKVITRRIENISHLIVWRLPLRFNIYNKEKLLSYKNIHKGKRCFIIANGPSLKKTDLSLLKDEISIGMNRIYLLKEQRNFIINYLVVSDIKYTIKPFIKDLQNLDIIQFIDWNARKLYNNYDNIIFLKQRFKVHFSDDLLKGIWGGHSVTYVCLQLAYYMGFKEVILIGKDHSYKEKGVPGKHMVINGTEDNHGISGYYQKNMEWNLPDYKGEELGYKIAKEIYERNGKKILDATIDGKLDIFEKVDYYNLF